MKRFVLYCLLLLLYSYGFAQYNRPGSTSAQFLKIGVSPRAAGMSDAFISVVDGAEATYYNAAALAWIKTTDIVFNHNKWFTGINHEFVAIARNFDMVGTFGLSLTSLYTDEMKVRTPLQPDGTGETFYAHSYRLGISYARIMTNRVTLGGTLNYINISLFSGFPADAISIDIAALYITDYRGFRFGMKIGDFGSNVKFINESYPLPTNFTFGFSANVIENNMQRLIVSSSATKPNDGKLLGGLGIEWMYDNLYFIRAGYRFNHDIETYSIGGGIQLNFGEYQSNFNYAYTIYSILGGVHRFGINIKFF